MKAHIFRNVGNYSRATTQLHVSEDFNLQEYIYLLLALCRVCLEKKLVSGTSIVIGLIDRGLLRTEFNQILH